MNYLKLLIVVFLLPILTADAQTQRCHSTELLELKKEQYPELESKVREADRAIQETLNSNHNDRDDHIYYVPVVVHVLWANEFQNITDEQIQSQIDVLNEDYNRTNVDAVNTPAEFLPVAASADIVFCLADMDPNGNETNGITRTKTLNSTWDPFDDNIHYNVGGGKDPWPTNEYLNMWVVNFSNSNILGYSSVPGWWPPQTDGPVINYRYFGNQGTVVFPFNKGRTVTHEVGHWLGLRHIWGDGGCGVDDNIDDTPLSNDANYGCAIGHISCGSVDMVQNYMDYSDDACFNLFTQDQADRMRATLETTRPDLRTSSGCYFNTGIGDMVDISNDIKVFPNPAADFFNLDLSSFNASETVEIELVNSLGQRVMHQTTPGSAALMINVADYPAGMYFIELAGEEMSGSRKIIIRD